MGELAEMEIPWLCLGSERPKRKRGGILRDTLVPRAAPEAVLEEASLLLETNLRAEWARALACRAEVIYAHNPPFRQLLRGKGDAGRAWLWSFMQHWLSGLIKGYKPHLYARLAYHYNVGCAPATALRRNQARKELWR